MNWLARWQRERALRRHLIPAGEFDAAAARLPVLAGLSVAEGHTLREQASLLIAGKQFSAAGGAEVDRATQLAVALQACLLTLHLDEASYRGWREIILYPDEFLRPREEMDEAGVVHVYRDILAGESWHGGPLVLSIADVEASGQLEGFNVVLHEFAHKLDMLNGDANGLPPLHRDMKRADWARAFSAAYEDLCARVDADEDTVVDPYASTNPAEFFAVTTEMFFEVPDLLADTYPAVYTQLQQFYRQDPLARLGRPT
ncbi:MAG: zinc-dependent peptidase [Thiobacillus sp.]|nr:zinc-dependent peptidase [Thiobacillus sp.]